MWKRIFARDRAIIAAALFVISALAWVYTIQQARSMGELCVRMDLPWRITDAGMTLLMWIVMMIAMMTPSAAPMVLLFAATNAKHRQNPRPYTPAALFFAGYLFVWAGFSVAATVVQWVLHSFALLSTMMVTNSPYLGTTVLLLTAAFQWTSLKRACLAHCRSPLGFFMANWRPGARGAFLMGLHHGAYCVGCCWALMALLFVAGVMNLLWVTVISLFVLAEKLLPRVEMVTRCASGVLVLIAIAMLKHAW